MKESVAEVQPVEEDKEVSRERRSKQVQDPVSKTEALYTDDAAQVKEGPLKRGRKRKTKSRIGYNYAKRVLYFVD